MLQMNNLGLEVIRPTMAINGLAAFGAYTEGTCSEGKDFVCGTRGGIHSCRPCNFDQLEAFRSVQGELNRVIKLKGLAGLLDIDGRMGPRTAVAIARVAAATSNLLAAPADVAKVIAAVNAAPDAAQTHRVMATYVPEMRTYFAQVADLLGATKDYPEAPMPAADKGGGGGAIPVPVVESDGGIVIAPPSPGVRTAGVGGVAPLLALVGILGGVGLAAWGYKRYSERRR